MFTAGLQSKVGRKIGRKFIRGGFLEQNIITAVGSGTISNAAAALAKVGGPHRRSW